MHKLQRGNAPECLDKYRHGLHNWKHVTAEDKTEIRQGLDTMQGQRCAYCEDDMSNGKNHIEHFLQRDRHPTRTFDWQNLFGSCNRETSCGKHKDRQPFYNPNDLIKPDEEDPEHFFLFVSDGTIAIREQLSANEKHRAEATLRIFNLDAQHGPLRRMRQKAVQGYKQQAEEFQLMAAEFPDLLPILLDEIKNLIADTAHLPFATAIKHTLSL